MSLIDIEGKFHTALDGTGLLLQGAPERPAYEMSQAPLYNTRFGAGDRSYSDFSFWWFWAQTDFSGGVKQERKWADDGMFYESEGVDVLKNPGSFCLSPKQTLAFHVAKAMVWKHFGNVGTKFAVVGQNETDQKMRIDDPINNANIWEDSATGATEIVQCTGEAGDGYLYIGCKTVGSGSSMFKKVTAPTTVADVGAHNTGGGIYQIVYYPVTKTFYLFSLSAGIYSIPLGSTTFTQVIATYPHNLQATDLSAGKLRGQNAWEISGKIYFTLKKTSIDQGELWAFDIATAAYLHIYTWGAGMNPNYMIAGNNGCLYFFDTNVFGRLQIWKYDPVTGVMEMKHEIGKEGQTSFFIGNPVKDSKGILFVIDDSTSDYHTWRLDNNDVITGYIKPPTTHTQDTNMLAITGNGNLVTLRNGDETDTGNSIVAFTAVPPTVFQTTGTLITSEFDAGIPGITKFFSDITFNFSTLVSGQSINLYYSFDGGATWVTMGSVTYADDGGVNRKNLLFLESDREGRVCMLKFQLVGGGSNTPYVYDFTVRYLPALNLTKQWNLNINCADELKRLDGAKVETTARELKGKLEKAWWTKTPLDFQDMDYATTLIVGTHTASDTTITVTQNGTDKFPEQGRMRVKHVVGSVITYEEILYTGKTRTTFTGCTRGARGTTAIALSANDVVDNAYRVILTDISQRSPILNADRGLEYIVGVSLREV